QDGAKNALAGEAGAGNDPRAHLMHERKHLSFTGPSIFFDSIRNKRLWSAATALIQRRNKAGICLHFFELLCIVTHSWPPRFCEMPPGDRKAMYITVD